MNTMVLTMLVRYRKHDITSDLHRIDMVVAVVISVGFQFMIVDCKVLVI